MTRKFAEPYADALLKDWKALRLPGFVVLQEQSRFAFNDRRLDRVNRSKHPCNDLSPGIPIGWQQASVTLRPEKQSRLTI